MALRNLCIGLTAISAAACATPAPSLEVAGDRLFVDALVNGVAVEALLDSAAEVSFADRNWAAANGLVAAGAGVAKGTGGETDVAFVENVSIEAVGVWMDGLTIAVIDLSDLSARLIGRPVRFVLGREIFDRERLAIDIEGASIEVIDRSTTPKGSALKIVSKRGIETFEARVNGVAVDAEFDLGNGSEILIGAATAERLGLLRDTEKLEVRKGGGLGRSVDRKIVRLSTLAFAGAVYRDVEAAVDETENAGSLNIGVRHLRDFSIVTDFKEATIWLERR